MMPQIQQHSEVETVVRTHADWVYACARRRVADDALARDVTQAVFILFWRKRAGLGNDTKLTGWLYRTVRYCAANALRLQRIRRHHEKEAAMAARQDQPDRETQWNELAPELEQALDRLRETYRAAILLRFYRQMSFAEVGQCLGISEDAAQKRVGRAIHELRGALATRGLTVGAPGLAVMLAEQVTSPAPAELVQGVASAAAGSASSNAIAQGAVKMMILTKLKVMAVIVAGVVAAGGAAAVVGQLATQRPATPPENRRDDRTAPTTPAGVSQPDALVQAALDLDGWIQQERKAGRVRISFSSAQVTDIATTDAIRVAVTMELPNRSAQPSPLARMGRTWLMDNARFLDRKGRPVPFTIEDRRGGTGFYQLQFADPVPPDGRFGFLLTGDAPPAGRLRQEGKLWYYICDNSTANCLNYFQVILPPSAVFVDCSSDVVAVKAIAGRTAVITRNYTGPQADGTVYVAFLWPDRDGSTAADLPPQYRGLHDERVAMLVGMYRTRMAAILAGEHYDDQSTPMGALLTLHSAIAQEDENAITAACYASARVPRNPESSRKMIESLRDGLADVDVLTTPPWPDQPAEGHIHPIELCRRGSLIRLDTYAIIYTQGKWRYIGNMGNRWSTNMSVFERFR